MPKIPPFDSKDAFLADAQRYRRELLAHCYRMTGSLHDAEDLVQETYLRAWKSYDGFQGRSSVRTWLYRIATNTCLTALDGRKRRPLPSGLGQRRLRSRTATSPSTTRSPGWSRCPTRRSEDPSDPSVIVESRESVRLAFIAALQHLSPRQRAVLVLREVLQWKAAEVGDAIGASTAAVNSLLQRARAQLDAVAARARTTPSRRRSHPRRRICSAATSRHSRAYDMDKLVELFTAEAVFEMPPFDGWYQGPENIVPLSKTHCPAEGAGDMRFVRITANGQLAAALYMLNRETGAHEEFQLHVLEIRPGGISHVVAFHADGLFEKFGLPTSL